MTKPVKVMLSGFAQSYAIPMAKCLVRDHEWKIAYWVSGRAVSEEVKACFPTAIFHDSGNARRGIPPDNFPDLKSSAIDGPLLNSMAETERNVLAQGDRLNLYHTTFSYHDRINLYHTLLKYWVSVMDYIRPDLVVFNTVPHLMYDQVIYDLCKQDGVQTVILEKTNITGLIYAYRRYEEGPVEILNEYQRRLSKFNGEPVPLSQKMEEVMRIGTGDYDAAIPVSLQSARRNSSVNSGRKLDHAYRRIKALFDRIVLGNVPLAAGKIKTRNLTDRRISRWEYVRLRWNIKYQRLRLTRTYAKLAQNVDLSKPYIYVALQYQPEQSTNPQGAAFQHQDLMVDLLAKSVPDDWNIYVKEHVAALLGHSQFERSRTPEFYRNIAAMPKVTLLKSDTKAFELIDNAEAVATISGSTGWEAVLRGRPAFLFGYSWYRGCEGIFETGSHESLLAAIDKVRSGYKLDREKICLYLQVIEDLGINGYNIPSWGASSGISPEENANAIAAELAKYSPASISLSVS